MHQVRYFLAVVEAKGFTKAAGDCNVSQPSLTAAIKKLEEELGESLFLRERGGVKLTPFGEAVLPRFRRLAQESESIVELAESRRRLERVALRIGVLATIGPGRLVSLLSSFRDRAPGVDVELHVGTNDELMRRLRDAELDAALSNVGERSPEECVVAPIYQERYLVVLPPGHPLEARDVVRLADLSGEPYVDRIACEMRDHLAEEIRRRGVQLYASYRCSREEWIQSMVRSGIGFALMPEHSIVTGGTVNRPLIDPEVRRTIAAVRWADRAFAPALKLFWETLRSAAQFAKYGNSDGSGAGSESTPSGTPEAAPIASAE
jgi:DNA-binding transcriptional LysR family regulator